MQFFSRKKFSDKEIVDGLDDNSSLEDTILKYLYRIYYPGIQSIILSKGGTKIEAKDIFQDVIIVFYQDVKSGKFELKAAISTYLSVLARNMWINRKKRLSKLTDLEALEKAGKVEDQKQPLDILLESEKTQFAQALLQTLSEDCRRILVLSIFKKYPMKKISDIMGYKNEQIARNKKNKCLKYLKNIIQKSTNLSNTLKELK